MDKSELTFFLENLSYDFEKIKEQFRDLSSFNDKLGKELLSLRKENLSLRYEFNSLKSTLKKGFGVQTQSRGSLDKQTEKTTFGIDFKALNNNFLGISTGNQGVQTDRQTNNQTDKQEEKTSFSIKTTSEEALDSLNLARRELRLKFKKLTPQELKIFCAIYQLEEEKGVVSYKDLSLKTNLSESSIRDYSRRLTIKGIPIIKEKHNNKEVVLKISSSLKKLASLETIISLKSS